MPHHAHNPSNLPGRPVHMHRSPAPRLAIPYARPTLVGRMLDGALEQVAPRWALQRHANRCRLAMLKAHSAAENNRSTADWPVDRYSADQANLPELADISARARLAVRDDWAGASIVGAWKRNVVGTGITPRATARDLAAGKPAKEFNERMDRLFRRLARSPKLIDVEGRKSLHAMMRLAVAEKHTVGQAFIVTSIVPRRGDIGLQLQMFELEQLATEMDRSPISTGPGTSGRNAVASETRNEIRNGIELDSAGGGRPVAYWVHLSDHPLETGFWARSRKPVRIPAERVLVYGEQHRPRETVSVSEMAPVLRQMFDRQSYDLNELFAKKIESFLGLVIKRDPRYGEGQNIGFVPESTATEATGGGDSKDAGGNRQLDFQPGTVPVLYDGEEIQPLHFDRPGANYDAYMQRQINMISAGAGLSGSVVARKSSGSYSVERKDMLEDWKAYDIDQQDLIDQVLRPIWELCVILAVMQQLVEAPGFFTDDDQMSEYLEADWQPPPRRLMDPAKEMAAIKIALDYALTNHADELNKQGRDIRDNVRSIREVMDLFEENRIPMPWLAPTTSPSEPKPRGVGDVPGSGEAANASAKRNGRRVSTDQLVESILAWAATHEEPEEEAASRGPGAGGVSTLHLEL